jgi:hypothetical protein
MWILILGEDTGLMSRDESIGHMYLNHPVTNFSNSVTSQYFLNDIVEMKNFLVSFLKILGPFEKFVEWR